MTPDRTSLLTFGMPLFLALHLGLGLIGRSKSRMTFRIALNQKAFCFIPLLAIFGVRMLFDHFGVCIDMQTALTATVACQVGMSELYFIHHRRLRPLQGLINNHVSRV